MTPAKSKHIQILRGLAITAVVLIHCMPGGQWQIYLRPFVNFAVGLFLFLSGMLSNAQKHHPGKRLKKVLIPYVLWSLIYTVVAHMQAPKQIPLTFLKNLITAGAAGMLYFIPVYCTYTLLIPWMDKLAKSKLKYLGFLIAPIEIFIVYLLPILTKGAVGGVFPLLKTAPWGWLVYYYLGWFTYFYLGYLLGNRYIHLGKSPVLWICLCIASLPFQMLESAWMASCGIQNPGTQMKLSVLLTGTFFVLAAYGFITSEKAYTCKALHILGDNAFGIYFSHIAIIGLLGKIPGYRTYAPFPVNAILTILVALLCIQIGKKLLGKYANLLGL